MGTKRSEIACRRQPLGTKAKPKQNACVEGLHAQVRLEPLDREIFSNLREVNAATSNYTTSNDRTAAWTKVHQPWPRSANFRSSLRPALQFALALLP